MWWLIGISAVSSLPVLFLFSRRQQRGAFRRQEWVLTPRAESLYRSVAGRVEVDLDLAVLTYTEAFAARELGSPEGARRLLDAGHDLVERCAPAVVRLLAAMATFARVASVVAPVEPLRPGAFRLVPLAGLAALSLVLDLVLVSTCERFRLRVYLLGHAYGLALRRLVGDSEAMIRRGSWTPVEWERIRAIHGDFVTLKDELLRSLRILLTSLVGQRSVGPH